MAILRLSARLAVQPLAMHLAGIVYLSAVACSPVADLPGAPRDAQEDSARALTHDDADALRVADPHARYPLTASPMTWSEQEELLPSDAADRHNFGLAVALSGDTALVGSHPAATMGMASAAYVFVRSAIAWTEEQKLLPSDGVNGDYFGDSVALSGDIAIVGAERGDGGAGRYSGAAYVFARNASTWTEEQKLLAGDAAAFDYFAGGVAVSGDVAIVGAEGNDDAGNNSGSAYIFTRSGNAWSEQQKLLPNPGAALESFGASVAISNASAIVGARFHDAAGTTSGAAYIFTRTAATWTEQQKILPSDGADGDGFGGSVSISGDIALVGAARWGDAGSNSGAAYVFSRSASIWTQQQKLLASDAGADDNFGNSVAVSGEATIIASLFDDDQGNGSGAAYVFTRNASTWTQQQKLLASDGAASDGFGKAVAMSGNSAIAGAFTHVEERLRSGAAYVFDLRLVNGQLCSNDSACASKHCTEGVCCDGVCSGPCEACTLSGSEGSCTTLAYGSAPTASCNGHLCNGLLGTCSDACGGDGECATDHYCKDAVACLPRATDGTTCLGDSHCLSGHCISGVCCATACDQGCGSCVVAGLEGTCSPLPQGDPGLPSCAPYVCEGRQVLCPESCDAHRDCLPELHCAAGACQPDADSGAGCEEDDACGSGHCTDGVCCSADSCGAYRCGPAGTCGDACSSQAQCAAAHECTSEGKCEPHPDTSPAPDDAGACTLTPGSSPPSKGLHWLSGMAWLAWRRQRCARRGAA